MKKPPDSGFPLTQSTLRRSQRPLSPSSGAFSGFMLIPHNYTAILHHYPAISKKSLRLEMNNFVFLQCPGFSDTLRSGTITVLIEIDLTRLRVQFTTPVLVSCSSGVQIRSSRLSYLEHTNCSWFKFVSSPNSATDLSI